MKQETWNQATKKMSELLNEPYKSFFNTQYPTVTIKYVKDFFGNPQANTLSDINITREDIIDALKTISQNSSVGTNKCTAVLLKQCSKSLTHPLQLLYKASLKTGEMPTDLKWAINTPIYKGGPRNLPKNYRSVALTSQLIKILDKNNQFLERNQKINHIQHGFRSGRSCLSHLHHNKISEELEKSTMLMLSTYILQKRFIKSTTAYNWTNSKQSLLMVKSVCAQFSIKQTSMCCRQ